MAVLCVLQWTQATGGGANGRPQLWLSEQHSVWHVELCYQHVLESGLKTSLINRVFPSMLHSMSSAGWLTGSTHNLPQPYLCRNDKSLPLLSPIVVLFHVPVQPTRISYSQRFTGSVLLPGGKCCVQHTYSKSASQRSCVSSCDLLASVYTGCQEYTAEMQH